ncbi:hypothetical protein METBISCDRAFT_30981 [Metschnikowia bicuspidata]|uniref:Uncharacterized protein n=1 Tax=Metschnikowia bicuspidata TaxID=27322 RepID=A0A4P9ZC39_9ASCO|nr:hypothetical protein METBISCDRAFT_30981 [Metschnikowia bicuspidata]
MTLVNSATAGLDDILDELKLKYDSLFGLLGGDALRELPSLNTLLNLNKLLAKLAKSLEANEEHDDALLLVVEEALAKCAAETGAEAASTAEEDVAHKKRDRSELEDAESALHAKRPKKGAAEHSDDAQDDGLSRREPGDGTADEEGASPETECVGPETDDIKQEEERLNSKNDAVPPEQVGSFTPAHDSRLKNPNSEFVTSQSLSAAAIAELGLWSEEKGQESQEKEYLKKKYAVASYPENDMKLYLPGEIPDIDFSKTKAPQNQVQFTTFQTYIESYFRPFTNEDIAFVNEEYVIPPGFDKNYDPLVIPYLIPRLGDFYIDVWGEEDQNLGSKLSSPAVVKAPIESYLPKCEFDDITDEKLLTEDISCGPLSSRLLSAILSIHECKEAEPETIRDDTDSESLKKEEPGLGDDLFSRTPSTSLDAGDTYKIVAESNDFYSIEERLKRELKYIGIFMNLPSTSGDKPKKGNIIDSEDWILNREDDEICLEMRALQEELKGAVIRNRRRKKTLLPILKEYLAYQEYCTIAEDRDKQVDQAYLKRLKVKSKKKKAMAEVPPSTPQQQAANSGLKSLLDKRTRWITNIGKVFKPPEVMKRIPSKSIFAEGANSDDDDYDADADVEVATEQT